MHEHETDEEGRQICTTSGEAPSDVRSQQRAEGNTGQHGSYIVLCEEERQKGFVRPYRDSYRHVGRSERDNAASDAGVHEVQRRVGGCGTVTTMARAIAETFARDPQFYAGGGFCVNCNRHVPNAELVWTADGQQVGS